MKILVKYNNSSYYWVDTVITSVDCIYAILASSEGVAFPIRLEKIEVVDESYNYEKQKERRINELKNEASHLKMRAALDAKLREVLHPVVPPYYLRY